jgi:hypothetical protein
VLEYFGVRNGGYVLMLPSDEVHKTYPEQEEFKQLGGILVPMYGSSRRWKRDLAQARQ